MAFPENIPAPNQSSGENIPASNQSSGENIPAPNQNQLCFAMWFSHPELKFKPRQVKSPLPGTENWAWETASLLVIPE